MEKRDYIAELLEHHDCVIIPGLGGFVGSYAPASVHPVYHTFQPPYKKILFNVNLRQNDGLLANHIAQSEQISFREANERVWRYSEECLSRLETRKQLLISQVGRLFLGSEGTIHFDQDMRFNHLPDSFGFQPFFSLPARKEHAAPVVPSEVIRLSTESPKRPQLLSESLKWAAALALPVGVAFLVNLSGIGKDRPGFTAYANILSGISSRIMSAESVKPAVKVTTGVPRIANPKPATLPAPKAATATTETAPVPVQQYPFAIIVGAFRIEDNAMNLVSDLKGKGYEAMILDQTKGGLYRVAAGNYQQRKDAFLALDKIKTEGFTGAWILSK